MATIYKLRNDAPQNETSYDSISNFIIESSPKTKGRPSASKGMWKLDNGDWAFRDDAEFKNISGEWIETTRSDITIESEESSEQSVASSSGSTVSV